MPPDVSFIIETDDLESSWQTLKENKIWANSSQNSYVKQVNGTISQFDSLVFNNKPLKAFLEGRKISISGHKNDENTTDLLFIVDLKKSSKLIFLSETLPLMKGFEVNKTDYKGTEIIELTDLSSQTMIYLSFVENLMVVSQSKRLVEKAVYSGNKHQWQNYNDILINIEKKADRNDIKMYLNHRETSEFYKLFTHIGAFKTGQKILNDLEFSGYSFSLEGDNIIFDGLIKPSKDSLAGLLLQIKPSKLRAYKIMSSNISSFLSISFKSFKELQVELSGYIFEKQPKILEMFDSLETKLANDYNLNPGIHLFNWIGNEVSFAGIVTPDGHTSDLLFIHTNDIEKAKQKMKFVSTQLNRDKPELKFGATYNNHLVYRIDNNKKVFSYQTSIDSTKTWYFTNLRNFMIFSDNEIALKAQIDDYVNNNLLSNDKACKYILESFDEKPNAFLFLNIPKLYKSLKQSPKVFKTYIYRNKDIISNMKYLAINLTANGKNFKVKGRLRGDENAFVDEQMAEMAKKTFDSLYVDEIEALGFKIPYKNIENLADGKNRLYLSDSSLYADGEFVNKLPHGIWKTYYKSGNLQSIVTYQNGKVNGIAVFYFDTPEAIKKIEVRFEDDKINGLFREYYQNGILKATITYHNGLRQGKSSVYRPTGNLLMEGEFKNSKLKYGWNIYGKNNELLTDTN